ncbi:pheromone processing endoprotease [Vanrija albida]|uniref:Pheromone processing endoprotease n=1 Tax=Vanrija albida TaxID=181172 RepID=A0ABR3QAS8_9TREE
MFLSTAVLLPLALGALATPAVADVATAPKRPVPRSYDTHAYYALELPQTADAASVQEAAKALGVEVVEQIGELAGHYLVRREGSVISARSAVGGMPADPVVARYKHLRREQRARRSLGAVPEIRDLTTLEPRQRVKRVPPPMEQKNMRSRTRALVDLEADAKDDTELLYIQNDLGFKDPLLPKQWHLANTMDSRWELNVTKAWGSGVTGKGVTVAMVDDGLDHEHKDLKDNYFAEGSHDYNDHDEDPIPVLGDDQHGTRCAGEVAAGANNDVCGVGVAYNAKVAGIRILSGPITDADEAAALNFGYQVNDIYSCSWGPPDDGKSMEAPSRLILNAMVNGVHKGRGGKGSIFVFAAGNGGAMDDQCNFDGYTNSIFSTTIGSLDYTGRHPYYSEKCTAMLVVTPSSGSGEHIHTTDRGKDVNGNDKCTDGHGGTSAAAPLAAGVFALALEARPELGWRDIQHIAINTAKFIHPEDPEWQMNKAGRNFSNKFGYGLLDAGSFVEAAKTWPLVKPQEWFDSPVIEMPNTEPPPDVNISALPSRRPAYPTGHPIRQEDGTPTPSPGHKGSFLSQLPVTSSFEITRKMLDDANFDKLEHVTVRVWIDHARRGDVEVSLIAPSGTISTLSQPRRFDEAATGYNGWRFMSLKHWGEDPVGTWTISVHDQGQVGAYGHFKKWSLQLWGDALVPEHARPWEPAREGEEDEEEIGTQPTTYTRKPKPTDHPVPAEGLPETAIGENTKPTGAVDDSDKESSGGAPGGADEGIFDGIDGLRKHSAWLAGAFLVVLLAALSGGAFFLYRQKKRRDALGLAGGAGAARGAYAPVADDEVPMGLLERGARSIGLRQKRTSPESKELYDAFGDGPSDDESDAGANESTALRYHDSFLEDDEDHTPHAGGSGGGSHDAHEPPAYRDDEDQPPREPSSPEGTSTPAELIAGESNTSSGSWQDAGDEDVRPAA